MRQMEVRPAEWILNTTTTSPKECGKPLNRRSAERYASWQLLFCVAENSCSPTQLLVKLTFSHTLLRQ